MDHFWDMLGSLQTDLLNYKKVFLWVKIAYQDLEYFKNASWQLVRRQIDLSHTFTCSSVRCERMSTSSLWNQKAWRRSSVKLLVIVITTPTEHARGLEFGLHFKLSLKVLVGEETDKLLRQLVSQNLPSLSNVRLSWHLDLDTTYPVVDANIPKNKNLNKHY